MDAPEDDPWSQCAKSVTGLQICSELMFSTSCMVCVTLTHTVTCDETAVCCLHSQSLSNVLSHNHGGKYDNCGAYLSTMYGASPTGRATMATCTMSGCYITRTYHVDPDTCSGSKFQASCCTATVFFEHMHTCISRKMLAGRHAHGWHSRQRATIVPMEFPMICATQKEMATVIASSCKCKWKEACHDI